MNCSYIEISNSDKKKWLLQSKNLHMAFNLYQPSSVKGGSLKQFLPAIVRVPVLRSGVYGLLHIKELREFSTYNFLLPYCEEAFDVKSNMLDLNFFMGTPCKHQKITIQVSTGQQILGYCRFSDNVELRGKFIAEKNTLDYLNNKEVNGVPKCLKCCDVDNKGYLFIQSTQKSSQSITYHKFGKLHVDFLKEVFCKTKVECDFVDTDYSHMLRSLIDFLHSRTVEFLNKHDIENLMKAVSLVDEFMQSQKEYCIYHGDFTPWNTYVESGKLFVFDFEYSKISYPRYLDAFHFLVQTCIYEKGSNAEEILSLVIKKETEIRYLFGDDIKMMFLAYLLDVIQMYLIREYGAYTIEVVNYIRLFLDILGIIVVKLS